MKARLTTSEAIRKSTTMESLLGFGSGVGLGVGAGVVVFDSQIQTGQLTM
jgi:hypothetical protein